VSGNADELLKRLEIEGKASPADLFITVDAGRLHRAKEAGVLQPIHNDTLEAAIPPHLRESAGHWFGLSARARTVFYAKDRVDPSHLSTYAGLADPRWKGRVCVRSSSNVYNQSLVAAVIANEGEAAAEAWARGLVANLARPPAGGDTDQLKAAAAGECDLAIANTYYFGRLTSSEKGSEREIAGKLGVLWLDQGQGENGVHVNVSGAGVTRSARHVDDAVRLLEYLVSPAAQAWYAEVNNEYPVIAEGAVSETLRSFGTFRPDDLPLGALGENNRTAVEVMDRAGWK
jgi:iron(III) transport system substrate-binding protein